MRLLIVLTNTYCICPEANKFLRKYCFQRDCKPGLQKSDYLSLKVTPDFLYTQLGNRWQTCAALKRGTLSSMHFTWSRGGSWTRCFSQKTRSSQRVYSRNSLHSPARCENLHKRGAAMISPHPFSVRCCCPDSTMLLWGQWHRVSSDCRRP